MGVGLKRTPKYRYDTGVASFAPGIGNVYVESHRTFLLPNGKFIASVDYVYSNGKGYSLATLFVRFDQNGVVEGTRIVNNEHIVGVQSSGKFITFGSAVEPYLHRYQADLSYDATFVITDTSYLQTTVCCVVVQPDDRILVGNREDGIVRRFHSDGSLDPAFPTNVGPFVGIDSIVSTTDNAFLVQEHETAPLECSARLFDSNGLSIGWLYQSFVFEPDNHCGETLIRFAASPDGGFVWEDRGKTIFRSKPDGAADTTFGTNGAVRLAARADWSISSAVLPVAVQADNKIVFGGSAQVAGTAQRFVGRLNSDGSFDTTFGTQGIFVLSSPTEVSEILVQPNGNLIVVGSNTTGYVLIRLHEVAVRSQVFLPIAQHR